MPELPEVETARRVLEPQLLDRTIEEVTVIQPQVIAHPGADEFAGRLRGQRFARAERRGKFLVFRLETGDRLVVHLRMTGCLLLMPSELEPEKYTHIVLRLDGGTELRFSDMRRFGRMWLIGKDEQDTYTGIEKLGPEPSGREVNAAFLQGRLAKSRRAIKECLLDQSVIAGIGNIYSDEILFSAAIKPARPACSLNEEEWERLAVLIPKRMEFFVEKNRISPEDYLATKGKDYRNTPYLQVYGHAGEPCPRCGQPLQRQVIGGRGSVFCPCCQL